MKTKLVAIRKPANAKAYLLHSFVWSNFPDRLSRIQMKTITLFCALLFSAACFAQDSTMRHFKGVYFPYPMDRGWKGSIGITNTTLPYAITADIHYRAPALDVHVLRKLAKNFYLDLNGSLQVLQNQVAIGPRWATLFSDKVSMSLGDDVGFWQGNINVQGIATSGHGFQNIPNISFGYRFKKKVLLTVRADAQINYGIKTFARNTELKSNNHLLGGYSYAMILEQPFFGKKVLTLGFRAIYTDFFWQTWTFFSPYDRAIFYPQIITGLNL
jgi:hypothetical protein